MSSDHLVLDLAQQDCPASDILCSQFSHGDRIERISNLDHGIVDLATKRIRGVVIARVDTLSREADRVGGFLHLRDHFIEHRKCCLGLWGSAAL
ncbi:hypothetical protein [Pararhodobacter aggregans]|uniref:hypothetical protein n=1 Tax=Pararhodobacter aggregans TaxID=404875 RepID=UPI003A921BB9